MRWRNFSTVFPRSNKKRWVFLQTFESNGSFFTRRNSELGLDFAIRWERNKDFPKKILWTSEIVFFFVKIQEIFENKCLPQKYTFRKKTLDMYILVPTTLLKRFCSNSVNFFSKIEQFSAISSIKFVVISFPEWSLYLELFFRAHRIHVSNPRCKKRHGKNLVTLKLAVLWDFFFTPRCRNHLQFARIQNESPDVPQNFIILPSDNFLIRTAAEEDLKLSWSLVIQKISLISFPFFYHPRFQSTLSVINKYWKKNSFVFYLYLRWRNFSIVFPRSNKNNWVFLQFFEWNGSFFTRRNSELGLDFAIRWERNKNFPKKSPESVELCSFVKIQEIFEIKYFPQKYTFRKINTWTCKFRFWQRCQKVFAQTPSSFLKFRKNFSF